MKTTKPAAPAREPYVYPFTAASCNRKAPEFRPGDLIYNEATRSNTPVLSIWWGFLPTNSSGFGPSPMCWHYSAAGYQTVRPYAPHE